jgi:hypothetical protein
MAAHLDLAESALWRGVPDEACERIAQARSIDNEYVVFGWRQRFKARELEARAALDAGDAHRARAMAAQLAADAAEVGVERYAVNARLIRTRAEARLGHPVDRLTVGADATAVLRVMATESWWRLADVARELDDTQLLDTAAAQMERLAIDLGPRAAGLVAAWQRRYTR